MLLLLLLKLIYEADLSVLAAAAVPAVLSHHHAARLHLLLMSEMQEPIKNESVVYRVQVASTRQRGMVSESGTAVRA